MSRFLLLTKTEWREPPRLRHQLARLLLSHGHEVAFFERPRSLLSGSKPYRQDDPCAQDSNIKFFRSSELLNHKLRLLPFLHHLNGVWEAASIRRSVGENWLAPDIVINFNYDYFFLDRVFPHSRIVTIINDDFWCRAIGGWESPLRWALKRTCSSSYRVLCVSEPLVEDLRMYCNPQLFLPWSEHDYSPPEAGTFRSVLLFWGFINDRLNWDYIIELATALQDAKSPYVIRLVGPKEQYSFSLERRLAGLQNIEVLPPCSFESLNLTEVLAAFIPYRLGNKADDVTTLPNKALPMLSAGLPLIITGMPNIVKAEFVFSFGLTSINEDIRMLDQIAGRFLSIQSDIAGFVARNSASSRYSQFIDSCV